MGRILLAWELGDGLGHVMRLLPLAKRLRESGHECIFAVRNVPISHGVIQREGFVVLQAPMLIPHAPEDVRNKPIATYGDILATIGYDDVDRLLAMVDAWQGLIDVIKPDMVVGDYAPTVGLTTYKTFPTVMLGDGFTLPPPTMAKFPEFRKSGARVPEERLLATVQETQRRRSRPLPPTMPSILGGNEAFIITLPELDFYRGERQKQAVGPLTPLPPPAATRPEVNYFCYLSMTFAHTQKFLDGLAASRRTGSCYLRNSDKVQIARLRDMGLTIHDRPPPMAEVGAKAAVIIHHGGLGTTETAMALGRPQILVPRHGEQTMNAHTLGRMGIAAQMRTGGQFESAHVTQALNGVIGTSSYLERAAARAQAIAKRGPTRALDVISGFCAELVAGRG